MSYILSIDTAEWRTVPWAPRYEASSLGDVRKRVNATHPERRQTAPIKPQPDKDGYLYLRLDGRKWFVHRLVFAVFCGALVDGLVVCHRDGTRTNNTPSNLLQAEQRVNIAHKREHGTHQEGERHGCSLVSNEVAAAVAVAVKVAPRGRGGRLRRGAGVGIAARLGVSIHLVYGIKHGKVWGHLA